MYILLDTEMSFRLYDRETTKEKSHCTIKIYKLIIIILFHGNKKISINKK